VIDALHDADYRGVLTLEVFQPDDFEASLALVHSLCAERAA
jgi:sugar phosphate isomerase/epimerase